MLCPPAEKAVLNAACLPACLPALCSHALACTGVHSVWACPPAPPTPTPTYRCVAHLGLPSSTSVRAVRGRLEPGIFTSYFTDWAQDQYLAYLQARKQGQVQGRDQGGQAGTDAGGQVEQVAADMVAAARARAGLSQQATEFISGGSVKVRGWGGRWGEVGGLRCVGGAGGVWGRGGGLGGQVG